MKPAFFELTKPRITLLVGLTTLAGFWVAARGSVDYGRLFWTAVGAMLVAAATGCLNQLMEIKEDALMKRTQGRPLPQERVKPSAAMFFGVVLALTGSSVLVWRANGLSCFLAVFTLLTYLLLYTPLKKRTPWATWIGAVPGAMPPLIGWVAARGALDAEALALYAIQFFWQIPHFLALAWIYREDYARAGFQTHGVLDPSGFTGRQITVSLVLLSPASLVPYILGLSGMGYLLGTAAMGSLFLYFGIKAANDLSEKTCRRLFLFSLVYLPAVFAAVVVS